MTTTVVPLAACQITGKQILDREASKSKSRSPRAIRRNLPKTNANVGSLVEVEDYCPAWRRHAAGPRPHVDNYHDNNRCTASSLPNYWEADLGPGGQQIEIPVIWQ